MSETSSQFPQPEIGKLVYKDNLRSDGSVEFSQIMFVDGDSGSDKSWNYTEVLISQEIDGKENISGEMSAGMTLASAWHYATDDEIKRYLKLFKTQPVEKYVSTPQQWLEKINQDDVLLQPEKDRLNRIFKEVFA